MLRFTVSKEKMGTIVIIWKQICQVLEAAWRWTMISNRQTQYWTTNGNLEPFNLQLLLSSKSLRLLQRMGAMAELEVRWDLQHWRSINSILSHFLRNQVVVLNFYACWHCRTNIGRRYPSPLIAYATFRVRNLKNAIEGVNALHLGGKAAVFKVIVFLRKFPKYSNINSYSS